MLAASLVHDRFVGMVARVGRARLIGPRSARGRRRGPNDGHL